MQPFVSLDPFSALPLFGFRILYDFSFAVPSLKASTEFHFEKSATVQTRMTYRSNNFALIELKIRQSFADFFFAQRASLFLGAGRHVSKGVFFKKDARGASLGLKLRSPRVSLKLCLRPAEGIRPTLSAKVHSLTNFGERM